MSTYSRKPQIVTSATKAESRRYIDQLKSLPTPSKATLRLVEDLEGSIQELSLSVSTTVVERKG